MLTCFLELRSVTSHRRASARVPRVTGACPRDANVRGPALPRAGGRPMAQPARRGGGSGRPPGARACVCANGAVAETRVGRASRGPKVPSEGVRRCPHPVRADPSRRCSEVKLSKVAQPVRGRQVRTAVLSCPPRFLTGAQRQDLVTLSPRAQSLCPRPPQDMSRASLLDKEPGRRPRASPSPSHLGSDEVVAMTGRPEAT